MAPRARAEHGEASRQRGATLRLLACGLGVPVQRVALRCSFLAHHGRLCSPHPGSVTLLALSHAVQALNLARRSRPFTLISESFPAIGYLLAHVGFTVSPVRDPVALICNSLALDQAQCSRSYLCLAHFDRNLARLDLDLSILERRVSFEEVFTPAGRSARIFRPDRLRPAPFQHRAGALVGGHVPMQGSALSVALPLPECR